MTSSQLLFDYNDPIAGRARRKDPISSAVAAKTCNAESERSRIRRCLQLAQRPLNVRQIVDLTGIPRDNVASRLPVMERLGQVRVLPELGVNDRGKPVQLWVARESLGEQDVRVSEQYL